ncbi:FAD-dependent monooxygenase [Actinoplanes sp. TBRC 11911]|uniref:FAD-dependent oxidoreductase n=1 Tax=Actinoplanes sp. TBRC 11911 TaxID=2729386 RepID=UPI00145E4FFF|nr:FAD-dependent oxidoreductase [Actinoplanes sp. TBRC 11911]NMO57576.1 FAD-dependent monooxygenase [Actinoplanes sp. TBRC 11911]
MGQIIVLGAGMCGLSTAMLLARDGHRVTVLERDPHEAPTAVRAWEDWQRPGVNQFRLAHVMPSRWRIEMEAELPEVIEELEAVGGLRMNPLDLLPANLRGPWRDGDERFETVTGRRPVLEAVLVSVAARTDGVTVRRGVAVTGLITDGGPVPRVTGVLAEGGHALRADLVVDCGGRRSALGSWLEAAGARRPVEEREDSGFVYFGRHFMKKGERPEGSATMLQRYESLSILTLPADNDTWSVTFVTSSRDKALRGLRDPETWHAALREYPNAAGWADGTPTPGVEVIAGIEDRHRQFVVDGAPIATGVLAVGDSWACTNPSLGRGATMGLIHAKGLRDAVRETGVDEHDKLTSLFHEWTAAAVEPMYRGTLWFDRHRLAELDADAAGVPYQPDDPKWAFSRAIIAAGLVDPDVARGYQSLASMLATPDDLVAQPGMAEKIMKFGGGAPTYALPGPGRQTLLAAVGG